MIAIDQGQGRPKPGKTTPDAQTWLDDLGRLDIRMIMALHAILTQQNIGRVARDFGRSQPGMSNALARMRLIFSDPLLVRTKAGMRLTPRGEQLRDHLANLSVLLERLIRPTSFDPGSSEENFRIIASDDASLLIAPTLIREIRAAGRSVGISLHSGGRAADDWTEATSHHLFLGYARLPRLDMITHDLFCDDLVIICRKGLFPISDPLRPSDITHLAQVAPADDKSEFSRIVTDWLEIHELTRNVAVRTSGLSVTPAIVSGSDLIALLPATLATAFARDYPLQIMHLADRFLKLTFVAQWPARLADVPSQQWLVAMIKKAIGGSN